MLERDTALLDELLADDYTLTHMTGYVQPKSEWLAQIDSGQMRYHSARPHHVAVEVDGDAAVLVDQDVVDATIGGSRGTWNLQLTPPISVATRHGSPYEPSPRPSRDAAADPSVAGAQRARCPGAVFGEALAVRGEQATGSRGVAAPGRPARPIAVGVSGSTWKTRHCQRRPDSGCLER